MGYKLNHSGKPRTKGGSGPLLDEGEYEATVLDVTIGTSSTGSPLATFSLEAYDGDRTVKLRAWIPLQVEWKVDQIVEAFPGLQEVEESVGRGCLITIELEYYDGKQQSKVSRFDPLPAKDVADEVPF